LPNSKAVEFYLVTDLHYIIGYACVYQEGISMEKPIKIVVYFDYLSPWCYIAAVRLQCLEEEYENKISISWRSYPLVVREIPNRLISSHSIESRRRAALEEDKIGFSPWNPDEPYPASSMPALRAAKCAQLQGEKAFRRFHIALFRAFFEEGMNISEREVLISLAKKAGLDVERFNSDFSSRSMEEEVLAEYEDGRAEYEGWGIPIVVVGERYPIAGAVPIAIYRRAIDLCLAS
jgi:predicted DsbA family dithiol-disulfide isomerase